MISKKIYTYLAAGLILSLVLVSCSTKKDKWNRRAYHNLTSHFNAYFNGNEALKEGIKTVATAHEDDYTEILEVFQLSTREKALSASPQFDRATTKASMVIHDHSMYFGNKEKVKWVYYSFLMMGKSQFYKQDYGTAKITFRYITTKYAKEDVRTDALMWLARIDDIEGNYQDALSNLDGIKSKAATGTVSPEVYRFLPMIYADIYLKQKNYAPAIPFLLKAIEVNKKKKVKCRLTFILAQVYQQLEQYDNAIESYQKVLKLNPSYQMDFNSRINMAKCFQGGEEGKSIKNQILKMLKDAKNKEYFDQIYYVLAEIELKEKNTEKAIEYLQLSVLKSVNNNKQKAFSALKLAQIFFDKQNYTSSQSYYDSTMLFLPKDYPDYKKLEERKNILTELVGYLITVQKEDSLQNVAKMSDVDRNKFIDKLIQAEVELERKKQEEELIQQQMMAAAIDNQNNMKSVTQTGAAKWYFYNATTLSFGLKEFQGKWGQRKLEDNWRLSSKEISNEVEQSTEDENDSLDENGNIVEVKGKGKKAVITDKKSREYYLKELPLSKIKIDTSNNRIEKALFGQGVVYKDKLNNNNKAATAFEDLLKRFPKTKFAAETYYHLYQIYSAMDMTSEANRYKSLLINEFPDSDYAKILSDPDYIKKLAKQKNEVKDIYKQAYEYYKNGYYQKSLEVCETIKTKYSADDNIKAKFDLLKCLCLGKISATKIFSDALENHIKNFPLAETKELAENILFNLRNESGETYSKAIIDTTSKAKTTKNIEKTENTNSSNSVAPTYSYLPESTHLFILLIDKSTPSLNEIRNKISNHNMTYFGTENLTITNIPINQNLIMIGVSNFSNSQSAFEYISTCRRNIDLYQLIQSFEGDFLPISESNYTQLFKTKDIDGYKDFYKKNYK